MSQPFKILPTKTKQYNEMRSTLEGYERRELINKECITQLEADLRNSIEINRKLANHNADYSAALKAAREALRFYAHPHSDYKDDQEKIVYGPTAEHGAIKCYGKRARACLATLGELLGKE
jgi:hypothetical protein